MDAKFNLSTLKEDHRKRVSENKVLRRIFSPRKGEKILHNHTPENTRNIHAKH
jgi:hypothetical protein